MPIQIAPNNRHGETLTVSAIFIRVQLVRHDHTAHVKVCNRRTHVGKNGQVVPNKGACPKVRVINWLTSTLGPKSQALPFSARIRVAATILQSARKIRTTATTGCIPASVQNVTIAAQASSRPINAPRYESG